MTAPGTEYRAAAFGLTVTSMTPFLGLSGHAAASGPEVSLVAASHASPAATWDPRGVEVLARHDVGEAGLTGTIVRHPEHGYALEAPGFGWATIDPQADTVLTGPGATSSWRWHRYVLAQALPFAASLRGLELLHAAAVGLGDEIVALAGSSRAGKSTVAAALVDGGAEPFTDDVLALETTGDGHVWAHPGPNVLILSESAGGDYAGRAREVIRGEEGEVALRFDQPAPGPLGPVVFLDRMGGALRVERVSREDPRPLLAATYETVRRDPARLEAQLSLLARIAEAHPLYRITVGDARPDQVAHTVSGLLT